MASLLNRLVENDLLYKEVEEKFDRLIKQIEDAKKEFEDSNFDVYRYCTFGDVNLNKAIKDLKEHKWKQLDKVDALVRTIKEVIDDPSIDDRNKEKTTHDW